GRFRTEESALMLSDFNTSNYEDSANYDPTGDAAIYFEPCWGTYQPGTFVVRAGGIAPWSTRLGLYLTREDAERAAQAWGARAQVRAVDRHVERAAGDLARGERAHEATRVVVERNLVALARKARRDGERHRGRTGERRAHARDRERGRRHVAAAGERHVAEH